MTIPTITLLPTPVPTTADPDNFDARADAFLDALPTMVTEENAAIAGMNATALEVDADRAAAQAAQAAAEAAQTLAVGATTYVATSTSSLTMAAGTKTILLAQAGKAFAAGDPIVAMLRTDPDTRLYGSIDTGGVTGQTLTVSVAAEGVVGSGGPFADWIVVHAAFFQTGSTADEVRASTSPYVAVTPKSLADAAAFITLTDAATVAWAVGSGFNAAVTLAGNRIIGTPTGLVDGVTYTLDLIQDATGSRVPTWAVIWDWGVGATAPVLSTAAGKRDSVIAQYKAATGKLHASFRKAA